MELDPDRWLIDRIVLLSKMCNFIAPEKGSLTLPLAPLGFCGPCWGATPPFPPRPLFLPPIFSSLPSWFTWRDPDSTCQKCHTDCRLPGWTSELHVSAGLALHSVTRWRETVETKVQDSREFRSHLSIRFNSSGPGRAVNGIKNYVIASVYV